MKAIIHRFKFRERSTPMPDSDLQVLAENSRPRAWSLTALATVALVTTLIHRQALAALASTVTLELSISNIEYGFLSSGMAAAFLLASIPAARTTQRMGPQFALAMTVVATSVLIALHSVVAGFWALLALRVGMGLASATTMPAAIQTVHRVLPFKDRARGIALLYWGSSLGSAICPVLVVALSRHAGWRSTFISVAVIGFLWMPVWTAVSSGGGQNGVNNSLGPPPEPPASIGVLDLATRGSVLRGCVLVAAAAPTNLVMLIWAAKYLVSTYRVAERDLGQYLFLPALMFGTGSLVFGELRARSARTRNNARPPRRLVLLATALCCTIGAAAWSPTPAAATLIAGVAMTGAGGLYTLATSDMLAHTPRHAVPATTGLTTVTQSLVYVVASPLIGKCVEHFGNYDGVLLGAALWVLPCAAYWLAEASTVT